MRTGNRRLNRWVNHAGERYGRLTVIKPYPEAIRPSWVCKCDCGNTKAVTASHLLNGHTKSCGCLSPEISTKKALKHGLLNTPEYQVWSGMKARCRDKKLRCYRDYGGRGIKVCNRWLNSFSNFISDMGSRPSPLHSINRKDNDGDYTPDNCHWATDEEQRNNKRSNHFLTLNGKTLTMAQWCREIGINRQTIESRLRRGWLVEAALTRRVG